MLSRSHSLHVVDGCVLRPGVPYAHQTGRVSGVGSESESGMANASFVYNVGAYKPRTRSVYASERIRVVWF